MTAGPQHPIGYRAGAEWGMRKDVVSQYASGDVVWIPPGSAAVLDGRVPSPGLYRVDTVFSISEDASFYYRVAPATFQQGRSKLKLELVTDWDSAVSDRIHVMPGRCDYTAGWVLLYEAAPSQSAPTPAPLKEAGGQSDAS